MKLAEIQTYVQSTHTSIEAAQVSSTTNLTNNDIQENYHIAPEAEYLAESQSGIEAELGKLAEIKSEWLGFS